MTVQLYYLKECKKSTGEIIIPHSLIDKWNEIQSLSFGTRAIHGNLSVHHDDNQALIMVSSDLWNELKIPQEGYVNAILNKKYLHIGPLIGIFTAGFTGSLLRPVGDRSIFFSKLLSASKEDGPIVFVFGAHHINWEDGTINGLFYSENGWEEHEVPFPNVVYDRLPNRKTENHSILKKIRNQLEKEYLIPWFNPGFFNKWEIHQLLHHDTSIKNHLPETIYKPTNEQIQYLLTKYNQVYIKPINGSLGLGIHQIIYDKRNNHYFCRFRDDSKNRLRQFSSLTQLLKNQFGEQILESHIAQQGISLLKIDRKAIDFRIHSNKNELGEWKIGVIAAKVAGRGSVTTHLRSGGEIKTIDEIDEILPFTNKNMMAILSEFAISVSNALDKSFDGLIGEIGLDIGIDKDGHLWLFEANSKPGRSIFKHPKLKEEDLLTRKLPISYAVYLSEKSIKHPEEIFKT